MLSANAIVSDAEQRTGVTDSELHLRPNLMQLVASLNADAKLPPRGEASAHKALVDRTADRLEGVKWLRDHPEIGNEVIANPVFLTGLPRSGTTFFQYLFDRDARFRLIRTWEGITPSPPPGFDAASVLRRKAEEGERRRQTRPSIAGFEALHLVDADGPEECHAFMEHSYAAAGLYNLFNVPSYFDYLMTSLDLTAAYRTHKRQLQLLQWRMPRPRWAVKYPNHVIAMNNILEVYPDARFVMTHRDPVQTLASIAKLSFTLRGARYDAPIDPKIVGKQMLDFVQRHIDRIMAFCKSSLGNRVTHVDYYGAIDNPAKAVSQVHTALGIDTPLAVREAVAEWHRRNPKGARGANPYALETFGLDADAVAERFGDYMRHFDIPREQEGLRDESRRVVSSPAAEENENRAFRFPRDGRDRSPIHRINQDSNVADDIASFSALNQALATARAELLAAAPDAATAVESESYLLRVMTSSLNDAFLNHLLAHDGLTRALPTKGGPNPDYLLCHAPIDATRRYRLEGYLNDSERVGVGLYSLAAGGATVLEGYARFDRSTDAKRFTLDMSLDASGPGTLKLTPACRVLLIRTLHRDARGQPCSLSLTGGVPERGLSPAMGSNEAALQFAGQATVRGVRQFLEWSRLTRANANRFTTPPPTIAEEVRGDPDTQYSLGYYELDDGESLEVTIPEGLAGYWSLHAYNHWCEYLPHASVHDLNALRDPDGRIRARIGPTIASGVLNRIDTLGRRRGVLIFRTFSKSDTSIPQARLIST